MNPSANTTKAHGLAHAATPAEDIRALGAVVVGDEADDKQRGEVTEMKSGLDHARLARRQTPRLLRDAAVPPNRRRTR